MERSATIGQLAKALAKAQGAMDDASKESVNPHFRSKYADLASVRAAIRMPFSQNDLSYVQLPSFDGDMVTVETILMHGESGEWIGSSLSIPVLQKTPHAIGSAITYCRRFSLMAVGGIAPDEDDDGNKASERPQSNSQRATTQARRPCVQCGHTHYGACPPLPSEPIDEIPHMEPNPAQQVAAEAKALANAARQDAAATATVAKMQGEAVLADPKINAAERAEARRKEDAERKKRWSAEVRARLDGRLKDINPRTSTARADAKTWLAGAKMAKGELTEEDYAQVILAGQAKLIDITAAEKALAGAFRPGEDDPLPDHEATTGEVLEAR